MRRRDGALVEAQRRLRTLAVRQDLVLRGWFRAASEVAALGAEEEALRTRHQSELEALATRRASRETRLAEMTAAVAVTIGDDARAAEVLGTSERKVTQARRSVSLSDVQEAIDRALKTRSARPPTGVEPFSAPKGASSLA